MYTIVHISHIFLYLQTSYARGSCRQVLHLAPALWAFRAAPHPFLEWLVPDAKCSGLTIEVNPVLTSANPWRTSLSHLPPADGQSISESKYGDLQKGQSDNGSLQFTPVHPLEKEAQHAQTASKLQRASPQPITLWIQHLGLDWHSIRAQNSPKIRSLRMQIMIRSVPATTHSNPKPTIQTKKVSLDFRTLKSYCTLTIIDLWPASFPPRKHEMGKRPPFPRPDLGREWAADLVGLSWLDQPQRSQPLMPAKKQWKTCFWCVFAFATWRI